MFSKLTDLVGVGLISWGLSWWVATPAGLIFGGCAIVLIGSVTDDKAVGMALRRGTAWFRYAWWRQIARENGTPIPNLRRSLIGYVPCSCGGSEDCPLCDGTGIVPDPTLQVSQQSPHPPLRVDPDAEEFSARLAQNHQERARRRSSLERIG